MYYPPAKVGNDISVQQLLFQTADIHTHTHTHTHRDIVAHIYRAAKCPTLTFDQGANYKKILRLSYDVIITYDNRFCNQQHLNIIASLTYDYRKLLSHHKIIVRFSCNQAPDCSDGRQSSISRLHLPSLAHFSLLTTSHFTAQNLLLFSARFHLTRKPTPKLRTLSRQQVHQTYNKQWKTELPVFSHVHCYVHCAQQYCR